MARPRFRPTDEQRQRVKALAGYGLRHQQIATASGIGCVTTLRKYFEKELTIGPLEAHANVRRTLFRLATSGRHPAATMFWAKTRLRWNERGKVEERRPVGDVEWVIQEYQPPRSPEDQKQLDELLRRFDHAPEPPVRWEGDRGYDEDQEEEAPRRRRPWS